MRTFRPAEFTDEALLSRFLDGCRRIAALECDLPIEIEGGQELPVVANDQQSPVIAA